MPNRKLGVVILAAGKGTRMKRDDIPKVANLVLGKALIQYVVDQAKALKADIISVIVGHQKEKVIEILSEEKIEFAFQEQQLGTGHAVLQTAEFFRNFNGDIIVLSGDVPLLSETTLLHLIETHKSNNFKATVLTVMAPNPHGYGRVLRTEGNLFQCVVEEKDTDLTQRAIKEINSGIYIFDAKALFSALPKVGNNNAQGEFYLPDVLSIFQQEGKKVGVEIAPNFNEIIGVNTVDDLKEVESILKLK